MSTTKVALALGSGGARGLSQIGVIETLLENNFEIVSIAGTSVGSLIGGLHASGHLEEFKQWMLQLDRAQVLELVDFTLNAQGFVKGDRVFDEMRTFVSDVNIEDLSIPYTAVSADLYSRQEVRFSSGNLFKAIRASVAVPSVLTPVSLDDQLLVDGGVVNPLPISAIPASDAEFTIAVNLNSKEPYVPVRTITKEERQERNDWMDRLRSNFSMSFKDYFFSSNKTKNRLNYFEIIDSSFDLMQDQLTEVVLENHKVDMLIEVPRTAASTFDFHKTQELIDYGKQKTLEKLKNWK